jgi:hypothetical protein
MFIIKIFWNLIRWWGESVKALLLSAYCQITTFISVRLIRPITVPVSTAEECIAEYVALSVISKNKILDRRMWWLDTIWRHSELFTCPWKNKPFSFLSRYISWTTSSLILYNSKMEVPNNEWQPNSILEYIYCIISVIILTSLRRRDRFQTAAASLCLVVFCVLSTVEIYSISFML